VEIKKIGEKPASKPKPVKIITQKPSPKEAKSIKSIKSNQSSRSETKKK